MRERLIIVFVAVAIGLIVTTLIFFLYQQTKTIPNQSNKNAGSQNSASPTKSPNYLTIDEPQDEVLSDRRLLQVKGRTHPEDVIVVSTNQEDKVVRPISDGKFAVSITIDAGANVIVVRSIAPDGSEKKDSRTVTFSTEEF